MVQYGLVHISVGDLLRAEVAAGTPAGQKAKSFMDNGDLVPNEASAGCCQGTCRQTCCGGAGQQRIAADVASGRARLKDRRRVCGAGM